MFFGLPLPAIWGKDEGFAELVEEIHKFIGNTGYYLVGIHAAAALFHDYFKRDNSLVRMLPRRGYQKQELGWAGP